MCTPRGSYKPEFRAELFRPPYAFAPVRPSIVQAPSTVAYMQAFNVTYSGEGGEVPST